MQCSHLPTNENLLQSRSFRDVDMLPSPRGNFRHQLVYYFSTYQITVRFHAFVILLIFFVPGQLQKKSCSLPKQLQVLTFLKRSPKDCRHFLLLSTCSALNIAWFTDETTCELVVSSFPSLENCYPRPEMLFQ